MNACHGVRMQQPAEKRSLHETDSTAVETANERTKKKRNRTLAHEAAFLENLPLSRRYSKSYMHRDNVSFVTVAPSTHFVITTSNDGIVKFWKKRKIGIEFARQYRAHVEPIIDVSLSCDSTLYATLSSDKTVKVFDVIDSDMINFFSLSFAPRAFAWAYQPGQAKLLLVM